MDKKGQIEYIMENAFRIGFTVVALLAFVLLIAFYINNKIDSRFIQAETLTNKIMYSDAIMLQDNNIFRIDAGIVDMEKVKQPDALDKAIPYTFTRHASAKVIIYDIDKNGKRQFRYDNYLNKGQWDIWKQIIDSGVSGKGSAVQLIKEFPVTCADTDTGSYSYCILVVEVIVPNS